MSTENNETIATAVAEYTPIALALAQCRTRYANVVYDLRTVKGNDDARKARKELVTLRTSLESKRKDLKAPLLAQAKLVDDEAKRITFELVALETPIDEQIRADEKRREDERAAKAEAERGRVAAIRARIAAITARPAKAAQLRTAALLAVDVDSLRAQEIGDDYAEFAEEARAAQDAALTSMCDMLAALIAHEAEVARLAAERAELARQQAEAAEQRRVAEQAAREERERQEREAAARRAEIEREEAAARERIAAAAREAKAVQDARDAEVRAEQERQESAAAAERARIAEQQEAIAHQQRALAQQQAEFAEQQRKAAEPEPVAPVATIPLPAAKAEKPTRPSDDAIIEVLALHFRVHELKVIEWLLDMDLETASQREAALL